MPNPYELMPPKSFWRLAVGNRKPHQIEGLWAPKWSFAKHDKIATAGSCFAQHIGQALARAGYAWYDAEPAPAILPDSVKKRFNYGIFSFRTGNIYTTALFRQWLAWSLGREAPATETWAKDGRFWDPFRPNIEPDGFASESELYASRDATMAAIRRAVADSRVFVFTLGLTEAWINKTHGYVYPMCPGTVAGEFDPARHEFRNYRYDAVRSDLVAAMEMMQSVNPGLRFLLTVSPVPLTATASPNHVLVATIQSKSTLRAVAGDLAEDRADTDYFPSFEIISSFPFKGMFYEDNMRTVARGGVDFVMRSFFAGLTVADSTAASAPAERPAPEAASLAETPAEDVVCEEILLEAFATGAR
jgi:hypothetical protein